MIYHVLPGDAVAEIFKTAGIKGEVIVCRECLIEGDVSGRTLDEFWNHRADFIATAHGEQRQKYFDDVVRELKKLRVPKQHDEINLWFEYELFCSANLWFCLYLLKDSSAAIYRVAPVVRDPKAAWCGFGKLRAEEMAECFQQRIKLNSEDIDLGGDLWKAYQAQDSEKLRQLSEKSSAAFPYLREVCEAEIDKSSRPHEVLQKILGSGITEFADVFERFSAEVGVYGFGDAQVKRMLVRL